MKNEEIKDKIEQLVTAIGATGELLGATRDSLTRNGFTREEAVDICAKMLVGIMTNNGGAKND